MTISGATVPRGGKARRRWRRFGIGIGAFLLVVTLVSLVANLLTRPPETIAPGYGAYVRVGSASVHYEKWGTAGTPIVLVPGAFEPGLAFDQVGPILAANHVVYALDLPDFGYTRYSGTMRIAAFADLVDGFIHALRLQPPTLVGHSLGAAVIAKLSLAHPRDVARLVFADGDGLPLAFGPRWWRWAVMHSPYMTSGMRIVEEWPTIWAGVVRQGCSAACTTVDDALVRRWLRPLGQVAQERATRAFLTEANIGLSVTELRSVKVRRSIIWGSEDEDGGSLSGLKAILGNPPVHVIQHAGHLAFLADPYWFAGAVLADG